ncbi:MAG: T9SS type A sorting domain-containing protein, partial [Cyclobacteriaceae bacterium]|nr:T9SS type A sorting domain-containing protein [Cyclobacteriaceae bacterium]
ASIFTWNASDGSLVNALGPQVSVIPRSTTVYTLTGSGLDLCQSETSITVFVEQPPLGIDEELTAEKVQLYPNPTSGEITVAVENIYLGELYIRIFNSLGKEMIVKEYNKQQSLFYQRLDVSSLSAGIYFLQMNLNGRSLVKRLVVR